MFESFTEKNDARAEEGEEEEEKEEEVKQPKAELFQGRKFLVQCFCLSRAKEIGKYVFIQKENERRIWFHELFLLLLPNL